MAFQVSFWGQGKVVVSWHIPQIPLSDARQRREDAKEQIAKGIDPAGRQGSVFRADGGCDF